MRGSIQFRFTMPNNGNGNLWWSIDYGPAHFTFMSSEHNWTTGSEQYKWLEQDLASVDRSKTPWIIFSGHRPMYTGLIPGSTMVVAAHLREHLEPLFKKYTVDVALWGHVHNYERTCPVFQGQCLGDNDNPQSTVHVVIGMGGDALSTSWADPVPEWSMFRAAVYGYTRLHITKDTFHLQFVGSRDGQTHDSIFLKKA